MVLKRYIPIGIVAFFGSLTLFGWFIDNESIESIYSLNTCKFCLVSCSVEHSSSNHPQTKTKIMGGQGSQGGDPSGNNNRNRSRSRDRDRRQDQILESLDYGISFV